VPGQTALAYLPIYQALHQKQIDFVVIGGQACNIWAVLYLDSEPALKEYEPFTSMDLDIYSGSQNDVVVLAKALGQQAILNESGSPAPVLGFVFFKSSVGDLPISFISGAYGIKDARKIFESRQTLGLGESQTPVHVMHPLLTMQGKVALAVNQPRQSPNDLRHLKMSLHYTRGFILELVKMNRDRDALKVCKRVLFLASSRLGRAVYNKFQIRLEDALPSSDQIMNRAPKLEEFIRREVPKKLNQINARRKAS
jgi:hypothetical protein